MCSKEVGSVCLADWKPHCLQQNPESCPFFGDALGCAGLGIASFSKNKCHITERYKTPLHVVLLLCPVFILRTLHGSFLRGTSVGGIRPLGGYAGPWLRVLPFYLRNYKLVPLVFSSVPKVFH